MTRAFAGWCRRHCLCAFLAVPAALALFLLFGRPRIDWPPVPKPVPPQILRAAGGRTELVGKAYVYDLGGFIDTQYLWRVEVAPELIPALVRELDLRELASGDEVPKVFWRQPPTWWRPPRTGPTRYFVSPGFEVESRGSDGSHYLMAYDEADGVAFVWHKDNF